MLKNSLLIFSFIVIFIGCSGSKNSDISKKSDINYINTLGYKGNVFYSSSKIPTVLLNRSISKESHIIWGAGNHTCTPVPVGSVGPAKYISQLKGIIPNTKIAEVMKEAIREKINVILVIGDGMGPNQMSLPIYMNIAEGRKDPTYFEKIMKEGESGYVTTNPANGLVTCSSAAGTAIACGTKTFLGMVGIDTNGYPLESALEVAIKEGYKTGLVTDVDITDATPACFYAHNIARGEKEIIAEQLALRSDINVIFGGGASFFLPKGKMIKDEKELGDMDDWENYTSIRHDTLDLIKEMSKKGYKIIGTENELKRLSKTEKHILGLFAGGAISPAIERENGKTKEPSLVLMADKDLELISSGNENYFTMIECGRIDWESHNNDLGAVYKAVSEMNLVLEKAYSYYSKNKENTLLIFTADHETGSLGIAYNGFDKDRKLSKKMESGKVWESGTDPLLFKEFIKLKFQKMTINKLLEDVKSIEDLRIQYKNSFGYDLQDEDIIIIYNSLKN
jgi:alkaline phosphatase